MKKVISIFCIILLLVVTSNLAVNIHFCGNKISSIDFFGKSKGCGSCDSKDISHKSSIAAKSCCKNIATIIHTDNTTTSSFSFLTQQQTVAIVPVVFDYSIESTYATELLKGSVTCNAPPNVSVQPYYILYRSLII